MLTYHITENNWSFPILDWIEMLAQNVPEITELMSISKKCSYLTGNTEAVFRLMNTDNINDELYRMFKSVEYEWLNITKHNRTVLGLPGNITFSYLKGVRDVVQRLKKTDSLESELRKVAEEIPGEWALINDSMNNLFKN